MGASNRHPSCTYTWPLTTETSKCISDAHANLLLANSRLEDLLLAEFESRPYSAKIADDMLMHITLVTEHFKKAKKLISASITTASSHPDEFIDARARLDPDILEAEWNSPFGQGLPERAISSLAQTIKSDRLTTAHIFVNQLAELVRLTKPVYEVFTQATVLARQGILKSSLEGNKIPLQRDFGILYMRVLEFMQVYMLDSLIATQISFDQRNHPPLIESAKSAA